jgi:hypothetical protein
MTVKIVKDIFRRLKGASGTWKELTDNEDSRES